jgi:putative phage-type endonuclease
MPSPLELHDPLKEAHPNSMILDFLVERVQNTQLVPTKFGPMRRGSVISYQQQLSSQCLINDFADTNFPDLPVKNNMKNNFLTCLSNAHIAQMEELTLTEKEIKEFEVQTRVQSSSKLWHKLRKGRITASNIGSIYKRKKEDVSKFLPQLKSTKTVQTAAMKHGLVSEPHAAERYSATCGDCVNIYPCGIVISPTSPWLAASPDRKVYNSTKQSPYGLLEIKCPSSDSVEMVECLKKDAGGFLYLSRTHNYYYQMMTQLAVTGLPWCDFFVWCGKDDTHHLETIFFDIDEWQDIKDKIDMFFFTHYLS